MHQQLECRTVLPGEHCNRFCIRSHYCRMFACKFGIVTKDEKSRS